MTKKSSLAKKFPKPILFILITTILILTAQNTHARPTQTNLLADDPIISEFMADNETYNTDQDDNHEDWIEIHNPDSSPINMSGWQLQDGGDTWTFPSVTIPANGYLLIWASGNDLSDPNSELHTNFKLAASGEYLGLLNPSGTIISEFAPEYPRMFADETYGISSSGTEGYLDTPTPNAANSGLGSGYPPIVPPFTDRIYTVGETVNFDVDVFDQDDDVTSAAASNLPNGITFDPNTYEFTGTITQAGDITTEVTFTDATDKSDSGEFKWRVFESLSNPKVLLNEYNAVSNNNLLGDGSGSDSFFGSVEGNGGDWLEIIVLKDNLDMRNWTIELWDRDNSDELRQQTDTFTIADRATFASIPSGTIITISEDLDDDISYDPQNDDWTISIQSKNSGDGSFITGQSDFDVNADAQVIIIRDENGNLAAPVAGETDAWDTLNGGVSPKEILVLCTNPSNTIISATDYLDIADTSTFGSPNKCNGSTQSLTAIQSSSPSPLGDPEYGPIVFSQIAYNLPGTTVEFFMLTNITPNTVRFYDPANPSNVWVIKGVRDPDGIDDYQFDTGIEMAGNSRALLVNREPDTFRTQFNVPSDIPIFGPFGGELNDDYERIRLKKPLTPDADGNFRYEVVDFVPYDDDPDLGWPTLPDDGGAVLFRIDNTKSGIFSQNWTSYEDWDSWEDPRSAITLTSMQTDPSVNNLSINKTSLASILLTLAISLTIAVLHTRKKQRNIL